jgi:hypothetical protein
VADLTLTHGTVADRKWRALGDGSYAPTVMDESTRPPVPLSHEKLSVGTSVVTLSPPAGAVRAVIRSTQDVNWTDTEQDPTSSFGMMLFADEYLVYDYIGVFKLIQASTATGIADVRVAYYARG